MSNKYLVLTEKKIQKIIHLKKKKKRINSSSLEYMKLIIKVKKRITKDFDIKIIPDFFIQLLYRINSANLFLILIVSVVSFS